MVVQNQVSRKYLEKVKEIKKGHRLFDMHTHPFELFYGAGSYTKNSEGVGVYSSRRVSFTPPTIRDIVPQEDERMRKISTIFLKSGMAMFTLLRIYTHTGPGVFRSHMDLSAIDKVLLLPVVRPEDDIDRQMVQMHAMFGGDEQFTFGWCIPESIPDHEILPAAQDAIDRYDIRAVKLHPNISRIDPASVQGERRIYTIIETCNGLKLPLIVHGGKSPQLGESEASCYAEAANLREIDWSLTHSPVVICHAGTYGCDGSGFSYSLRTIGGLLLRHSNMLVDISALELSALIQVLKELDIDRVVFGSDMLYESQWATVVKLLIALESTTHFPEEMFLKITSLNPQKYLFSNGQNSRLPESPNQPTKWGKNGRGVRTAAHS